LAVGAARGGARSNGWFGVTFSALASDKALNCRREVV